MVSSYLMGGLGNQLFQIATGLSLAIDNGVDFKVDIDNGLFTQKPASTYKDIFYSKLNLGDVSIENKYNEPQFNYNKIPYSENIHLYGYFQSEKYFKHNRYQIIKTFENTALKRYLNIMYAEKLINSVAIHIRRGDYMNIQNIHPIQSIEYYKYCIEQLESKASIDNILVFSDDIEWCKANFDDERITFISGFLDYQDLVLMSMTEHNIIANSSFSWWGAWLNTNPNQIVYAPKMWFGQDFKQEWYDVYTTNMILV